MSNLTIEKSINQICKLRGGVKSCKRDLKFDGTGPLPWIFLNFFSKSNQYSANTTNHKVSALRTLKFSGITEPKETPALRLSASPSHSMVAKFVNCISAAETWVKDLLNRKKYNRNHIWMWKFRCEGSTYLTHYYHSKLFVRFLSALHKITCKNHKKHYFEETIDLRYGRAAS